MKNFTRKRLQMEQLPWWWSASLYICSSYKQERYCLEVLTWNLVFEVALRASIVFLNTFFILNSSVIRLHKILNFEFSTLEPKNWRRKFSTHRKPETTNWFPVKTGWLHLLSDWFEASLYFNKWPIRRTWPNTGWPKLVHLMKSWTCGLGVIHLPHWLLILSNKVYGLHSFN